ncbi:TIGR04283 family arsenosugar biosynthesis glycosyltransferase [Euzebyella saccharophila]|uniref:TIGR04283 family arsenosugar biosynthesis glycosyltransferase n=1 Tax=Euzebyella saccharophila TaxID=679664 RepID=A0ABV8JL96_9FLAO|nr:TIGR04283 family arsenosugar biosynthesis glycosyltransferase [Euzebyella saccharophila]
MEISIIIPVLNEEKYLGILLNHLKEYTGQSYVKEIIVVDGGSTDLTKNVASQYEVKILDSEKGRAKQMNLGAQNASGAILYFLHADTLPPPDFHTRIKEAVCAKTDCGCFRMKFDQSSPILSFFAWFTKLNFLICRGGDQTLFVTKGLFEQLGGFNEAFLIYEDTEFISRLYKSGKFQVLNAYAITSARKYQHIGIGKLQYHFGIIHLKRLLGATPEELYQYYQQKIAL